MPKVGVGRRLRGDVQRQEQGAERAARAWQPTKASRAGSYTQARGRFSPIIRSRSLCAERTASVLQARAATKHDARRHRRQSSRHDRGRLRAFVGIDSWLHASMTAVHVCYQGDNDMRRQLRDFWRWIRGSDRVGRPGDPASLGPGPGRAEEGAGQDLDGAQDALGRSGHLRRVDERQRPRHPDAAARGAGRQGGAVRRGVRQEGRARRADAERRPRTPKARFATTARG